MELSKKVGYIKGLMAGLKIDDSTPEGQVLAAMSDLLEEMAEEVEINSEIIDNVTAYIDDLEYCDDDCDCCGDECDCCDDEEEDDLSDIKAVEYDEDPMPEHECGCSACAAEEPASQPAQSAPEAEVPAPATASQPADQAIWGAMKKANPKAVWVAQAWQANPRQKMIENLPAGDLIVLDLFAESRPQWGDPESTWYRKEGFGKHDWLYCMLLNYGGNVGLHGKMKHVIDEFYKAKTSSFGKTMKGVGMTMEGSENNPVMFELLCELPWRPARFDKDEWLKNYTVARYGKADKAVQDAWLLLSNTIYNCPAKNTQQGTHESVFCGRPDYDVYQVSSWSEMEPYYKPEDIIRAAGIMLSAADRFKGNNNFEYDLIDIVRQAVAEKGRLVYPIMIDAYKAGEKELFAASSQRFLDLILLQDKLLAARPEFKVGTWIEKARNLGTTPEEKDLYEWNARVQVTTWGNRVAADEGGLRDYAHKEWNGLLRDFYYNRWKVWIDRQKAQLNGAPVKAIDFYAIEEPWTKQTNPYSSQAEGDVIEVAKEVYAKITE